MSVTKWRGMKLVAPVILVVVRSLDDQAKDRHYRPGRVTLRVAGDRVDHVARKVAATVGRHGRSCHVRRWLSYPCVSSWI